MRPDGSPYRKAKAKTASLRLKMPSIPRRGRSRLLLAVLACILLFWMLPGPRLDLGRTLLYFFFSPNFAGSYGSERATFARDDILKYVNPLIGTTNGGSYLSSLSRSTPITDHFSRACLPRCNSALRYVGRLWLAANIEQKLTHPRHGQARGRHQ
jgi:hypothetical protein